MSKRMSLIVLLLLAFALSWSAMRKAVSQQSTEPKQALGVIYPNSGILISGSGTRYGGIIYVKVFPVSEELVQKYGSGPMVSVELNPSQRDGRQLPLGKYEVHFAMRTGSEMKTFILRDVILRADGPCLLTVEMNADAKTTIVGGDTTVQQMEESLHKLQQEVTELKQK